MSFGSFSLRELTCAHCVYLALWTRKVLCGSFLCAIYKFSFIHRNVPCSWGPESGERGTGVLSEMSICMGVGGGFFYTFVLFVTNGAPVTPHPNPFYDSYNHGPLTLAKRSARNNAAGVGWREGGWTYNCTLFMTNMLQPPFPRPLLFLFSPLPPTAP